MSWVSPTNADSPFPPYGRSAESGSHQATVSLSNAFGQRWGGALFAESRCSGATCGRISGGRLQADVLRLQPLFLAPRPFLETPGEISRKKSPGWPRRRMCSSRTPGERGMEAQGGQRGAPSVCVGLGSWFTSSPPLRKACELRCKVLLGAYVRFFNPSSLLLVPSRAGRALLSAGL